MTRKQMSTTAKIALAIIVSVAVVVVAVIAFAAVIQAISPRL